MATNTRIREFIIDDHDIVNGLFAYSGSLPVTAGTVVTTVSPSGYKQSEADVVPTSFVGMNSFANTVSTTWTLGCKVKDATSGDVPLGLLRYDIRAYDENGLRGHFYRQKWAENEWLQSGQGVSILNAGFVFISGAIGAVQVGSYGYASGAGVINAVAPANAASTAFKVGKFWGAPSNDGLALFQIKPD